MPGPLFGDMSLWPGAVTRTEALSNAREAAEMAIGLDEVLAEAHASLGVVLSNERGSGGS